MVSTSANARGAESGPRPAVGSEAETAILEAARDLLAQGGVEALSMRHVADRVGISATAIYHYFEGKQDLIDRVVRLGFERFGEYLEEAMRSHPEGSLERVRALGEAYMRFALENQEYFRVMFSIQSKDRRPVEELPEGGGYFMVRQAVIAAMDAGTMRRADPDLMAHYLWSSVHGLVTLLLSGAAEGCECEGKRLSPSEIYHAFDPFVLGGIRA
ncbi:MAG: TetR/AcrR family transcriptional regulator [Gemmatimonadales bacterium]